MAEEDNKPTKSPLFDDHTFKLHKVFDYKKWRIYWSFDTLRNNEGKDRLICNGIRAIGIFGMMHLATHHYNQVLQLILTFIFLLLCGITKVRYYQNNKKLEFMTWA